MSELEKVNAVTTEDDASVGGERRRGRGRVRILPKVFCGVRPPYQKPAVLHPPAKHTAAPQAQENRPPCPPGGARKEKTPCRKGKK